MYSIKIKYIQKQTQSNEAISKIFKKSNMLNKNSIYCKKKPIY